MNDVDDHAAPVLLPVRVAHPPPGEPAMQTASVDIVDGQAVASPVKAYHLTGWCYDEYRRRERLPKAA